MAIDQAPNKPTIPAPPQSVNRAGAYFREMYVPAPKTSRELFRLLSLYDKETGVSGLAKRTNFADVGSAQLYFSEGPADARDKLSIKGHELA